MYIEVHFIVIGITKSELLLKMFTVLLAGLQLTIIFIV